MCFEQAKSKCGQVTLLREASMADQATACGQQASVNATSLFLFLGLKLKQYKGTFIEFQTG